MEPVAQEEPAPEMDDSGFAVCYFNDEPFEHGSYVHSGDQVLRCERGIWMVIGTEMPEFP